MRLILTLLSVLFISGIAHAQRDSNATLSGAVNNNVLSGHIRICTPSKGALLAPPLIIIYSHDKIIYKSAGPSDILSKISPQSIKSINVFKDSLSVAKLGGSTKNGVIEIYLDDKNYPDAYKIFKTDSAENKKR